MKNPVYCYAVSPAPLIILSDPAFFSFIGINIIIITIALIVVITKIAALHDQCATLSGYDSSSFCRITSSSRGPLKRPHPLPPTTKSSLIRWALLALIFRAFSPSQVSNQLLVVVKYPYDDGQDLPSRPRHGRATGQGQGLAMEAGESDLRGGPLSLSAVSRKIITWYALFCSSFPMTLSVLIFTFHVSACLNCFGISTPPQPCFFFGIGHLEAILNHSVSNNESTDTHR